MITPKGSKPNANIGPRNRLYRYILGVFLNAGTLLIHGSLPPFLFWTLVILSYIILLQAATSFCFLHSLFKTNDMR